jgi:hypothetical protein
MSIELQTQSFGARPLFGFIRDGVAGNYDIVYQMARIVRKDVTYDKGLERAAKQVELNAGLDEYSDASARLAAIFHLVRSHVKYVADIAGKVESLKNARQTLSDGYGDCDDLTVLLCTLAGLLGFEEVFIALAKYGKSEASFSHVYAVVYKDKKRYVMDASLPDAKFNEEIKPFEVREIDVFGDISGLDGVSGIYNNAKHYGKQTFKTAVGFVPLVADQLPLGFVASRAFSTGSEMLGQIGNEKLSINATASLINKKLDSIIQRLLSSSIAFDSAKAEALQITSQLGAVEYSKIPSADYDTIKTSIKNKLVFIRNFEDYAKEHNIKVIHLNAHLMLAAGLALTGGIGYTVYQNYKNKRR